MKVIKMIFFIILSCLLVACFKPKSENKIVVATSAEYPPFEYMQQGSIVGFDIDLINLIGKKLQLSVEIKNMQFSSILPVLLAGKADLAISTITITEARKKQLAFSMPYYFEQMAAVFKKGVFVTNAQSLCGKKVAAQLGTTMAIWLKNNLQCAEAQLLDSNPLAIEALKSDKVDVVMMDGAQAIIFAHKNPGLESKPIVAAKDGYGVAFTKESDLLPKVDAILKSLQDSGEIEKLKHKWLGVK